MIVWINEGKEVFLVSQVVRSILIRQDAQRQQRASGSPRATRTTILARL